MTETGAPLPEPAADTAVTNEPVRIELDGERGILRVTLSRPERRNCLDHRSFELLGEAFGERAAADGVRCVVLRGEGSAFCSGLDRTLLAGIASSGGGAQLVEGGARLQAVLDTIEACPRPTLAAVQGACIGGGLALLLACDLRVAADNAFFAMMEMRYAFLPDLGHVHRLQREVSAARAREMLFFGDRVDAATFERWGALNEVVPLAGLDAAAARWEERCALAAPRAVTTLKRILAQDPTGADGPRSQRATLEANAAGLLGGEDFFEGLTAATEGRPPRFTGR